MEHESINEYVIGLVDAIGQVLVQQYTLTNANAASDALNVVMEIVAKIDAGKDIL